MRVNKDNNKLTEEKLLQDVAEINKKCITDFNSHLNIALKNELSNTIKSNNYDNKAKCAIIYEFLNNRASICGQTIIYERVRYITELVVNYGNEELQNYWYNELAKIDINNKEQLIKNYSDKLKNIKLKNHILLKYNIYDRQLREQLYIEDVMINHIQTNI